ncbi:MAG: carboxylesterase family protein [Tunicatimonas sp.]
MKFLLSLLLTFPFSLITQPSLDSVNLRVQTTAGTLQGTYESGIRVFRGVPFAQPPVGNLRWQAPQPVQPWEGVRQADTFGPRAMQRFIFSDMNFRSDGVSEDCLYLNVWTPAQSADEKLPVLVYFYGGGFVAGDGSEYRYDGESMARQGIVTLTVNYRLGAFGFFAHPELTKESPRQASGNYGLLDQAAALQWVHDNIAAFGGDPDRVTIAGESAGSFSVSAQMASPLARDLIAGAIGESGSLLASSRLTTLAEAEQAGQQLAKLINAPSLTALRAVPADSLLAATARADAPRFTITIDGYFFPQSPDTIYAAGQQAPVPLLLGWNSAESIYQGLLGDQEPTPENYAAAVNELYGDRTPDILQHYPGTTQEEVMQSATDLASDQFIGFGTWKWGQVHTQTSEQPVYRYYYTRPRPPGRQAEDAVASLEAGAVVAAPSPPAGAVHSAEIEYALGNLPTNRVFDWQPEDYRVSAIMQGYFVNFIKTGDPNGLGLPQWPAADAQNLSPVMYIGENTRAQPAPHPERYRFLDQ